MRELIAASYPEHGILGEEHGLSGPTRSIVWVLDPIDGTKSFITGRPLFGTLIALVHHGAPVLGMIDQPILRRTLGWRRRHRIGVERPADPGARLPHGSTTRYCSRLARPCSAPAPRGRLRAGAAPGSAADVRRRLLRLRAAGHRPCRSGRRGQHEALRLRGAGPGGRGRRRAGHRLAGPAASDRLGGAGRRRRRRRFRTEARDSSPPEALPLPKRAKCGLGSARGCTLGDGGACGTTVRAVGGGGHPVVAGCTLRLWRSPPMASPCTAIRPIRRTSPISPG